MPEKLRVEERELFDRYMGDLSIPRIGVYEYAIKYGSDELRSFYREREKEDEEAAKKGWIIN